MRIKAKLAASALLAAGLLSGCVGQPGTAAIVDGERITVEQVDEAMALGPFFQDQLTPSNALATLIESRAAITVAAEHGVGVSQDEAAAFLDEIGAEFIAQDGDYTDPVLDIVRMSVISQELGQAPNGQAIVEEIGEYMLETADIEFNPRYGEWDSDQGGLVDGFSDWIELPN